MLPDENTEDSIINQLDDDTLNVDDAGGAVEQPGTSTQTETPGTPAGDGVVAGSSDGGTPDPNAAAAGAAATTQQQQQQQVAPAQGGDLIDPNTGQVVARAGAERRMYENMQRSQGEVTRLTNEVATLRGQVQATEQMQQLPQQLGLNNDQVSMAMQLMASYAKNPLETIKYMLTEAAAAGHNVSDLGGQSVDMGAIGNMMDQRLKPLLDNHAATERANQANATANQEANSFLAAHPDAVQHEAHIAALITRDSTLTPREAYLTLKMDVQQRGLNWSQPLQPQYAAAQGGNGLTPAVAPTLPNGKQGAALQPTGANAPKTLDADADIDDIVGAALDDAGIVN